MRAGSGFVQSTFAIAIVAGTLLAAGHAWSFPIKGTEGILPADTELGEDVGLQPRELFRSDANGGKHSYLVNLGDMAFSSPGIFGGPARQAGLSCESCHNQGASNPNLFVPGLSTRPGTFDTTGALFNPKTDNHMNDALTVPSLRGAKFTGGWTRAMTGGAVQFDQTGLNVLSVPVMVQWRNKELVTVWPKEVAKAKAVWKL